MANATFDKPANGYITDPYFRYYCSNTSTTSYSFDAKRSSNGNYACFVLCGTTGSAGQFMYIGFVNTAANNNTVTLAPVIASGNTFTVTYNGSTLTINSSGTVWGGVRLFWLA